VYSSLAHVRSGAQIRVARSKPGTIVMRRALVVVALLLLGLALPSAADAQSTSPSLTGEFLSSTTDATITSFDCDNTGGRLSFSVSGIAAGPYPGTFTETGSVELGARDIPIPGAPGQFRAPILRFEAQFTITSALGTVSGTKTMTAPSDANFGGCNASPAGFIPHTAQIIASVLRYEATLPDGATDRGRTFANFNASSQPTGPTPSLQFREGFTSDEVIPPSPECSDALDNDNDGRTDYPSDPGCESPTDDSESPDPTPTAAVVVLTPAADVNPVGTQHTVTATAMTATSGPAEGVMIRFSVLGASDAQGTCTTDAQGQCTFTYTGPELPGADLVTGCADNDQSGTIDVGEPCGEATKIWMLPATTPGQVTGGGWITVDGNRVSFGFNAQSDKAGGAAKGNCNVIDHATRTQIKCRTVDSLLVTPTHATFFGRATVAGAETNYRIDVDDLGEPGLTDTFKIQTDNGYTAAGTLRGGNIQIHR
jgi:hypothetical protein